jgi:hypothetical protein
MVVDELTANAMLCDHAQVSGNKLFISGANISWVGSLSSPEGGYQVSLALAALVRIPWTATNQEHRLTVELLTDAGEGAGAQRIPLAQMLPPGVPEDELGKIYAVFNAGRAPQMSPGEESLLPIALPMHGLRLPHPGQYWFSIHIDGTEVDHVNFKVLAPSPMAGILPTQGFEG